MEINFTKVDLQGSQTPYENGFLLTLTPQDNECRK